jgi:hypothetical protein
MASILVLLGVLPFARREGLVEQPALAGAKRI